MPCHFVALFHAYQSILCLDVGVCSHFQPENCKHYIYAMSVLFICHTSPITDKYIM